MKVTIRNQMPMFPISIPSKTAEAFVSKDASYQMALRESRYIQELTVYGSLHEDGTLEMWAWCATDNGFCQTSGKFWEKVFQITEEEVEAEVEKELRRRAIAQIAEEDEQQWMRRVEKRIQELRKVTP